MSAYGLLNQIYTKLHAREEFNCESEADGLFYIVTYDNNQVEIYEVEKYLFRGDEWGTLDAKYNEHLIETIKVSIEEYLDAVILYANNMSHPNGDEIMKYEYPYVGHSVEFNRGGI